LAGLYLIQGLRSIKKGGIVTNIVVPLIAAACLLSACSNAAVSKAVGTAGDGDTPIVVRPSKSAVVVENHAGRPLLNVRITIEATDILTPLLDPSSVRPRQVQITARDTLAKSYDVTVPWKP
jgi:hypothetical protein